MTSETTHTRKKEKTETIRWAEGILTQIAVEKSAANFLF